MQWLQMDHGNNVNSKTSTLTPKELKLRTAICTFSWKLGNNLNKFWLKWDSSKWKPIAMLKALSGISMHCSSLKPILLETLTTHSSFLIPNKRRLRTNNIWKRSKRLMKLVDSEVKAMIMTGISNKLKRTS